MDNERHQRQQAIEEAILDILVRDEAQTLYEAEEIYLDRSMPELLSLLGSRLSNEELSRQPIIEMVLAHGRRGSEDSTL